MNLVVLYVAALAALDSKRGRVVGGATAAGMTLYWVAVRLAAQRRFLPGRSGGDQALRLNLHLLLVPQLWPQLLGVGAYIAAFVWLERKRLPPRQRVFLWSALLCVPVTLYFGIWAEARTWLEWTLPLAALASSEWTSYSSSPTLPSGAPSIGPTVAD
ncbi:MAG TPA: hypothetical protein VGR96_04130 [Acidobacteriaceae bacterium]|nr:hypothetical protein [Acidobacteriaceae bacterium]